MSSSRSRSHRPESSGRRTRNAATGSERATSSRQTQGERPANASAENRDRRPIPRKSSPFMDAGRSVRATQAKNRFGAILKSVRQEGPVFIEKHGTAQAVVLDVEAYRALLLKSRSSPEAELDTLRAEFHALFSQMQTEKSHKAVDSLFAAPAEKLNRTAASRAKARA